MHEAEVRAGKPSKAVLAAVMPLEDAPASQLDTPKGVIWVITHIFITERTGGWDQNPTRAILNAAELPPERQSQTYP